jgi:predicted  nucleic acid-binding Zn-ribbon protein
MSKRKEPADYRAVAASRKAVWLGPMVPHAHAHTWWKCLVCGRRWRAVYNKLEQGSGCPDCGIRRRGRSRRLPPEAYHALAAEKGIRWVGPDPGSVTCRTEWECAKGHRWATPYAQIRSGSGCHECTRQEHRERCAAGRHDAAAYHAAGGRAGLDWLGPEVADANRKTQWRCRTCGRVRAGSYAQVCRGGCPRCRMDRRNERMRVPAEQYEALAQKRDFTWLGPRPARRTQRTRWRCPRGHEWETSYRSISDRGSNCHVCEGRVNGRLVSGIQRVLADRLGGELNHPVGRYFVDVALEREGVRIAVEYDSWFYHGHPDRQTHDEARDEALVARGWRVLRIRSSYDLPAGGELEAALAWLLAGEQRVVITTGQWGVGPCRGAAFDPARTPRPYHRRHGGTRA